MTAPETPKRLEPADAEATDADVDAVLAEFGGDARAAIRALLHDVATLARSIESSVSWGFVRGRIAKDKRR